MTKRVPLRALTFAALHDVLAPIDPGTLIKCRVPLPPHAVLKLPKTNPFDHREAKQWHRMYKLLKPGMTVAQALVAGVTHQLLGNAVRRWGFITIEGFTPAQAYRWEPKHLHRREGLCRERARVMGLQFHRRQRLLMKTQALVTAALNPPSKPKRAKRYCGRN